MSRPQPTPAPRPARRDPLLRLLALLAAVFGAICLSCCLGSWVVERNTRDISVNTPGEVRELSNSIATPIIPNALQPWKARRTEDLISTESTAVWRSDKGSLLLLARVPRRFDPLSTETSEIVPQVPYSGLFDTPAVVYAVSMTTAEVQIEGVKISFDVRIHAGGQASPAGVVSRRLVQINGAFPRPDGSTGLIMLQVLDGEFEHLKLLQSLADPGSAPATHPSGQSPDSIPQNGSADDSPESAPESGSEDDSLSETESGGTAPSDSET